MKTSTTKVDWGTVARELKRRWLVLTIVGAYLVAGGLFAALIYKMNWDQPATRLASRVFPLPAARVNGDFIWLSSYYDRLAVFEHYGKSTQAEQTDVLPEDSTALRRSTLDQLVDQKLLRQEAERYGISVTDKEAQEKFQAIVADNQGEENFSKVLLELYGVTPMQFAKEFVPTGLYEEKIHTQLFTQVHPRYIVVQDGNRANEIIERLKKGEDFAELAKNFSQDTNTREQGGDLGWLSRGKLRKEIEDAAFLLAPGEFSQTPVVTDGNIYTILKMDERKDAPISDKSYAQWLTEVQTNAQVVRYVAK